MELAHERRDFLEQSLDLGERNEAHLTVLDRDGIAGMVVAADGIEAHDLADHVKAVDLFVALVVDLVGFEKSGTDGIQRLKRVAHAV